MSLKKGSLTRCQVHGCENVTPPGFYRRYRICSQHASAPVMVIAHGGPLMRFCGLCRKFEPVSEFEGSRKSCRKKLAEHNHRRMIKRTRSLPTPVEFPGGGLPFPLHPAGFGGGLPQQGYASGGAGGFQAQIGGAGGFLGGGGGGEGGLERCQEWHEMLALLDADAAPAAPSLALRGRGTPYEVPVLQSAQAPEAERYVMLQQLSPQEATGAGVEEESPFSLSPFAGLTSHHQQQATQQCAPQPLGPQGSLGSGGGGWAPPAPLTSLMTRSAPCTGWGDLQQVALGGRPQSGPLATPWGSVSSAFGNLQLDGFAGSLQLPPPAALPPRLQLTPAQQLVAGAGPGSALAGGSLPPQARRHAAAAGQPQLQLQLSHKSQCVREAAQVPSQWRIENEAERVTHLSRALFSLPPNELPNGLRQAIATLVAT